MDETRVRLVECFSAVFPELSTEEIIEASSNSVQSWDSVAGVTLLAVIEETFGIRIDGDDLERFNSFKGYLDYLKESDNSRQVSGDGDAV